jgi:hypothetical protein
MISPIPICPICGLRIEDKHIHNGTTFYSDHDPKDSFDYKLGWKDAIQKVREAVANYIFSEGCSCCEGKEHDKQREILAGLLEVEKYEDGSGYDFGKYTTKQ